MIRFTSLLALPLVVLAGCTGYPKDPPNETLPIGFVILDADGDGNVTRDEWEAYGEAVFAKIDLNRDGIVRDQEIAKSFSVFDLDANQVLTVDEIDMKVLDTNHDGVISPSEWDGHLVLHGFDEDRNDRVPPEEFRVRRWDTFTVLDRNATGRISTYEVPSPTQPFSMYRF